MDRKAYAAFHWLDWPFHRRLARAIAAESREPGGLVPLLIELGLTPWPGDAERVDNVESSRRAPPELKRWMVRMARLRLNPEVEAPRIAEELREAPEHSPWGRQAIREQLLGMARIVSVVHGEPSDECHTIGFPRLFLAWFSEPWRGTLFCPDDEPMPEAPFGDPTERAVFRAMGVVDWHVFGGLLDPSEVQLVNRELDAVDWALTPRGDRRRLDAHWGDWVWRHVPAAERDPLDARMAEMFDGLRAAFRTASAQGYGMHVAYGSD